MSHPDADPMVRIRRGNVHLSRELCDAYLPDVAAVALLVRDDAVLIVPLARQSAGGLLLKIRNARGDRVLHAQDIGIVRCERSVRLQHETHALVAGNI